MSEESKASKPEAKTAWAELARDARYFPALLAVFVLAFLLLFFKDLGDQPWRRYLVASLTVYSVGAAVIAHINGGISYKQSPIGWRWLFAIWGLHLAWFVWLMIYLLRREVL